MVAKKQWLKWKKQFPWLQGRPSCAKCCHCRDFQSVVIYQRSQLLQHHNSKVHSSAGASTCPTEAEFGQLLDERFASTSLRKSKLGPHKSVKMLWCVHEGIKDITKARVNRGLITASISQDGQGAGLGVRACLVNSDRSWTYYFFNSFIDDASCVFASNDKSFQKCKSFQCVSASSCAFTSICAQGQHGIRSTSFVLAYQKGELGGSRNLAKATRRAIRRFFTSQESPPRGWIGPKPRLEAKLLHKFSMSVETCQ